MSMQFEDAFERFMHGPDVHLGGLVIHPTQFGSQINPAEKVNEVILNPFREFLYSQGLHRVQTTQEESLQTCSQGKHIALLSRQTYSNTAKGRTISILAGTYSVDGRFYPLIPAWFSENGTPHDFGPQSDSFEQPAESATVVIRNFQDSTRFGLLASEHTHDLLRIQLKRACINIGFWQAANGQGYLDCLSIRSGFLALLGWYINQRNKQQGTRTDDFCVGFSALNVSEFPAIKGRAVIAPSSEKNLSNKRFYEVGFDARYEPILEVNGLDRENLQVIEITALKTYGHSPVDTGTVELWITDAKPGTYFHTKSIYGANGDSAAMAQRVLSVKEELDQERKEGKARKLFKEWN